MDDIKQEANFDGSPEDWLKTSIIFARTISLFLKEKEGIVVDIKGDVELGDNIEKVIVFKKDGQIVINAIEMELEEGSIMMVVNENSK